MLYISILCLACATGIGVVYPLLLRYLIDRVIKEGQYQLVPRLSLLVILAVSTKGMFQFFHGFMGGRLGNRFAYHLRNALYRKLQYLSFPYYDRAKTGDLMSRLTADLEATRLFVGFGFAQILNLFLMVFFGTLTMVFISWKLALVTFAAMPFLAFTAIRFEGKIHPVFRTMRQAMSNLTTSAQENITGVRTVKSFAREPYEVEKFSLRSEQYKSNQIEVSTIWSKYFPFMEFFANLSIVILLAAGGYLVLHETLSLGDLVAFFSLIWYIIAPMWMLGFHINNYTQSKASGERMLEVLNHHVHVKDNEHAVRLEQEKVRGHVQFDNVTFAYPDKPPAICGLSFDAPPGTVIGFLGATGSGKSTVLQLLLRAYNVNQGRILLDGKDIGDIQLASLRRQIAIVFQETFLFSSSIENNIAYGEKNASFEKIVEAAKLAQAHDFIMELPEGYRTIVGERGMGLSGGQKQRIAIARALLKDPKILLLDDATSAVDMETEHAIQAGLKQVMKGRTTFIIAHRISSLKHADEIIVLDEGKAIQRGTHRQLLREAGPYLEIYKTQYADHPGLRGLAEDGKVTE